MLGYIVLLGTIAAIVTIVRKNHREAFVTVYLVSLLCLPGWARAALPMGHPNFHEAAMIPIALVFFFTGMKGYRFSPMDVCVLLLPTIMAVSEYNAMGWADARNLIFDMIFAGICPYFLAKSAVFPGGLRDRFLRNFVLCVCFVIATCIYESRFGFNLYRKVFDPFFPGQGEGWVTTFRYGLARAAGAYGHSILAGVIFMFALRLQCWLSASGRWGQSKIFGAVPKGRFLTGWSFLGLALSLVRGPQIGCLIAWGVSLIARGRNPKFRAQIAVMAVLLVGVPTAISAYRYASVGRENAKDSNQETAAYRKELLDKYTDIALEHAWLGWGLTKWPKLASMPSIDNYFLLLALMHGVVASGLLAGTIVIFSIRLYRDGMRAAPMRPGGSSLSFCLFGLFLGHAFAIATVYMGEQVFPVFMIICGLAEGHLLNGGDAALQRELSGRGTGALSTPNAAGESAPSGAFRFRRAVS